MKIKKSHLIVLSMLLIAGLVLAGCAPAEEAPAEPIPTEAQETAPPAEEEGETGEVEVVMQNNAFQPAEITISASSTVIWTNEDAVGHTVTSGMRGSPTEIFNEDVGSGSTFSFTFEEPGTFEYFCSIHPGMDGSVIVE